jgi:hypothetical protein
MTSDGRSSPSNNQGIATRAPRGARRVMLVVVVVLTAGVGAVWSLVARRQLTSSIATESAAHLERARRTFDTTRSRTLNNLRGYARVMVEDPRLKSTLAIDGVDEITIADILGDLAKLRRAGFLIVLSTEGRVLAQAGADELRGLDLSGSSAVKEARSTLDAVVGSWVIGSEIMDLSIMPVRFGTTPIAYLVVGLAIDQDMLNAVAGQTDVAVATATGHAIVLASPHDDAWKPVFAAAAELDDSSQPRAFVLGDEAYVTAAAELEDRGHSRPRLVLVQALSHATASFAVMQWLLFIPPVLMLVAVLFAMTASRRVRITR